MRCDLDMDLIFFVPKVAATRAGTDLIGEMILLPKFMAQLDSCAIFFGCNVRQID
jgi:hypothetical protein